MTRSPSKLAGVLLIAITIITFPQPQIASALPIEDIRLIATPITVRIDRSGSEGNQGSGVIVNRQGNTYTVLTNWHVVKVSGEYIIQTSKEIRYTVRYDKVQRIGSTDLAELQFTSTSSQFYQTAQRGNSNDVAQNETIYVPSWINPTPSIRERIFYTATGRLVTRSRSDDTKEGYSLGYSLDLVQVGMSGGAILDKEGRLIGINGLGIRDPNTGTVGLVAGIPINVYAQAKGLALPASSNRSRSNSPKQTGVALAPHLRLQIQIQDIEAELTLLRSRVGTMEKLERDSHYSDKVENINKVKENLRPAYKQCDELDKQIEAFRELTYQSESKVTSESFIGLVNNISNFKKQAASLRGDLDELSILANYNTRE